MTPEELTNTTSDGLLVNHNFTWMPSKREDCPCIECQDLLEREEALDHHSIWPHRDDYTITLVDQGFGNCLCGKPIEQFNDYNAKKKARVVSAKRHVLVQFFTTMSLGGDSLPFKGITRVRLHRWCVGYVGMESRQDLDMEHQVKGILMVESLPEKGIEILRNLFEENPNAT